MQDHSNLELDAHRIEEEPQSGELHNMELWIRARIIHTLKIFPKISKSMLQVGIGTSLGPKLWNSVYEQMVEEGDVIVDRVDYKTPAGRSQTYTIITLNPERYPPTA